MGIEGDDNDDHILSCRIARAVQYDGRIAPIAPRVGDALATYWVRREAIKTLRQLDDRTLRDIGLSRCQIEPAVAGDLDMELVRIR